MVLSLGLLLTKHDDLAFHSGTSRVIYLHIEPVVFSTLLYISWIVEFGFIHLSSLLDALLLVSGGAHSELAPLRLI